MAERDFQSDFITELKERIPGCIIQKNDSGYKQGIPDIVIFYKDKYAILENKIDGKARFRPNQKMYLEMFAKYTFSRKATPENKEEIINELRNFFGIC